MTPPVFIVKRFWQGVLVKTYGPFAERGDEALGQMIALYAGHDLVHLKQLYRIVQAVRA